MIKAGIIGSTGYAGAELVRLLLNHPEADGTDHAVMSGIRMRMYMETFLNSWMSAAWTTIWIRWQNGRMSFLLRHRRDSAHRR